MSSITFEGLPDISQQISEVFAHYDDALNKAYESNETTSVDRFVDAWLASQKEQGVRAYCRRRQAESSSLLSLKNST